MTVVISIIEVMGADLKLVVFLRHMAKEWGSSRSRV